MFTGLVETTGKIIALTPGPASTRLTLEAGFVADGTQRGDSIAVNGCCLTVVEIENSQVTFDLLNETLHRTNLHAVSPGRVVNLERSLRADARLGGHFVTGHIDGTAEIAQWGQVGTDFELVVRVTPAQTTYLVPKGCIAVDGISLTVVNVTDDTFSIWIIPHTRSVTALRERGVGDLVNLEFDLLAKYTEKILSSRPTNSVHRVNPV
jgi:riboflavin synthase